MSRKHRDLLVWQEAIKLVVLVYSVTESFPKQEVYGLTSQMPRAASSIPANIAEGAARGGTKELLHFLSYSNGSLSELDTHFEIAVRLGFLQDRAEIDNQMETVFRLLSALIASLRKKLRT